MLNCRARGTQSPASLLSLSKKEGTVQVKEQQQPQSSHSFKAKVLEGIRRGKRTEAIVTPCGWRRESVTCASV